MLVVGSMNKTPIFKEFGPLLFGRQPGRLRSASRQAESLDDLYGALGSLVDDRLLEAPAKGRCSGFKRSEVGTHGSGPGALVLLQTEMEKGLRCGKE